MHQDADAAERELDAVLGRQLAPFAAGEGGQRGVEVCEGPGGGFCGEEGGTSVQVPEPLPTSIVQLSKWSGLRCECVLTDGKDDGRPAAVVHVPPIAYLEELLEAETATSQTGACCPFHASDLRDRWNSPIMTIVRSSQGCDSVSRIAARPHSKKPQRE